MLPSFVDVVGRKLGNLDNISSPLRLKKLSAFEVSNSYIHLHCRATLWRLSSDDGPERPFFPNSSRPTSSKPKHSLSRSLSSTLKGAQQPQRYSLRARLREETQNPFRKVRMFIYGGFAISAAVGAFISGLRIIAFGLNVQGTQPVSETVPNFAINLGFVGLFFFLLRREVRMGDRNLGRLSRGAQLAALQVMLPLSGAVLSLYQLRGKKRVVIVSGPEAQVLQCMDLAKEVRKGLEESSVIVVPYVREAESTDFSGFSGRWTASAIARAKWDAWLNLENENGQRDRAGLEKGELSSQVKVFVVRMDGRVGARFVGEPMWQKLIEEIKRLPKSDRYGQP